MTVIADTPQGWEEFLLDELFDFANGVNADKSAYGDGIPFANVLEVITNEALSAELIPGRIKLPAPLVARYQVRPGDVLFNRTSETQEEVGLSSVYLGDRPIVFGGFVFRAQPKTKRLDIKYSKYALRAHRVREQIVARGQGGIRANIGQRDLKRVRIMLPQPQEQRAIAQVMFDVDDQITTLGQLITKKQAIKQGMMHQLLTGKTRLPGFSQAWISAVWGDVTERCVSGATPLRSQNEFYGGKIPWVTSTELKYGTIKRVPQTITEAGVKAANLTVWPEGTFLMAITGLEAAGTRGSCGLLGVPAATNQSCMAVVPNRRLATGFLYYFYLFRGEELALRYCQGTKQQSYTAGIVKTLPILLPSDIDEQRAIAGVLADVDDEIDALLGHLAKAKAIKQGMMQELLTGRTRLPTTEIVA
jgi:type I restriction enzyme, S subunit